MVRYRHSGLVVRSQLPLPEWADFAIAGDEPADVAIDLAGESASVGHGEVAVVGGQAQFAVTGIGTWTVADGRRVTVSPDPAADARELRLFTLGTAWGLLGYQRGHAMWHGSAVERGGAAVLFCGRAGEGKSTMAAAMVADGARLVGDDLNRVEAGPMGALMHPSSARLKLWVAALDRLGWRDRVVERDLLREDKFHSSVPAHHAGGGPLPLAAIVVLASGDELQLERLRGSAALAAVLEGTVYRGQALERLGLWGQQGALAARIVARAQVWRLTRPRDLARLDACVGALRGIVPPA